MAKMQDDYSRIQQAAFEAKKSKHISDWVIKKIVKNYTEIKITALGNYAQYFIDNLGKPKCNILVRWMPMRPYFFLTI